LRRSASAAAASATARKPRRQRRLGAAVGARELRQLGLDERRHALRIDIELAEQRWDDAVGLADECGQQVLGFELRMVPPLGELLRLDDRVLGFFSELVQIHCRVWHRALALRLKLRQSLVVLPLFRRERPRHLHVDRDVQVAPLPGLAHERMP